MKKTMKLTRKIQLVVDLPTAEERQAAIGKLYHWQTCCYRTANLMVSHLYAQEMMEDFFYLSEGTRVKLWDERKDPAGIFITSRMNTIYQVASRRFKGEMPTNIISCLKGSLYSEFTKSRAAYRLGERSLPNFRKDMPFPFSREELRQFAYVPAQKAFCFRLFGIPLKTYLGRDFSDKRRLLQQLAQGELPLCTSKLQLKNKKIYWLPVFELEKTSAPLQPGVVAEASLSLAYPLVVKVGKHRLTIGTKEEFLYRRLAIQAARKRAQQGATYAKSGKGRRRKLKAVAKFKEMERNYVRSRLHLYSRRLIDFCLKHQAGTLLLLEQADKIGIAKQEEFVLRNWSYDELLTLIQYKAAKVGIEVVLG